MRVCTGASPLADLGHRHAPRFPALTVVLLSTAVALCPPAADAATTRQQAEEGTREESAGTSEDEHANTLRWKTATEVDNFGFDVYRSVSEDGPFERINEDPIPGAGTTDEPTSYEYVDDTIDPTRAYYYYLESISMSGERKKFTPTIHAKAKAGTADEEGDGEG
jgi:hypothetical protein